MTHTGHVFTINKMTLIEVCIPNECQNAWIGRRPGPMFKVLTCPCDELNIIVLIWYKDGNLDNQAEAAVFWCSLVAFIFVL